MKNKKIVLASVLKPVNDARMYEKFGISLSQFRELEIHIAGFSIKAEEENKPSTIFFHPIFSFPRISFARTLAPVRFLKLLLKVKPDIVIVTTVELLIVTILNKILFGTKIYYDVQENYYRNIACTQSFPPVLRNLISIYARGIELLSRPFISKYILAERNYEREFSFSKGKSIIIENKARKPEESDERMKRNESFNLIFSGTISESTGIFEAIEMTEKLHKIDKRITLTIIGYCPIFKTFITTNHLIKNKPYIKFIGGDDLVPHSEILKEIAKADFGLVCYRPNKSTENCIPTKIFEYQAHLVPMIVQENPVWREACESYKSAIFIDYQYFDPTLLLQQMKNSQFYPNGIENSLYWESEETKLLELIK